MNNKAQSVISFVIATVIFMFVIVFVVQSTLDWLSPMFLQSQENERKVVADSVLSLLVSQPGEWAGGGNWEENPYEVTRLGLASEYMVLSRGKISALGGLDSEDVRELLGPKYNYIICVGENCRLAKVVTGPASTPGQKFSEGTFLDLQGAMVRVRVTVQ